MAGSMRRNWMLDPFRRAALVKVVRPDAKKPTDAPPAPRTPASTKAERQAPAASAVSAGASATDALKSTFVTACLSPTSVAVGL